VAGVGQLIPGMDAALDGMTTGETKTFTLEAEDAYGERSSDATTEIPTDSFPEEMELTEGLVVPLSGPEGNLLATVTGVTDGVATFDLNHPLAGKALTFEVEILSVETS
jgi:peptidylprolyl isomerase